MALGYRDERAEPPPRDDPRRRCRALAAKQYGVISRKQALSLGLSPATLGRMVASGELEIVVTGIYRSTLFEPGLEQEMMVAQLFAAPAGALSHVTAGRVHRLDVPKIETVHVTADIRRRSIPPNTVLHRNRLLSHEVARVKAFVVTDVVRTLLDLGSEIDYEGLEIALDSAVRRGLVSVPYIHRRLERTPPSGRKGFGALTAIISERGDVPAAESPLETKVARLLRRYRLPPPTRQYVITTDDGDRFRVDFAYPHCLLAIEVQSSTHHFGREPWEKDLHRSSALAQLGWRLIYVTDADVRKRPQETAERIRRALAHCTPSLF